MSTQSIIHNSDNKIAKQINKYLYEAGTKYILFKRFSIGTDPINKNFSTICRLHKLFCNDFCMISDKDMVLIKETINNELIFSNPEL